MNLFEVYKAGGPFMHVVSIMGIASVGLTIWKFLSIFIGKKVSFKLLYPIKTAGLLALSIGFLAQIIGILMALSAIRHAGDVSPELLYAGVTISFYAPIWGFIVLVYSLLAYTILKEIIRHKS